MSTPLRGATATPQAPCPFCFEELDRKGICWHCYDDDHSEEDKEYHERRRAYRGGRWIVDGFMRTRRSEAEAIALAEEPGTIIFALELCGFSGLVDILADRCATEALRQLVLARDKETLRALADCQKGGLYFNKVKRGPRPKTDVHLEREVLRLKRTGKTNGQIAKLLGTKKSNVAAAYNNITNKIARVQIANRRQ
jgi:hypothetical protein